MTGFRVLDDYARREHLELFRRHTDPFYTVSFELDATRVRARAKALGASTYAALVFAYHRAMLPLDAFRTRLDGERVILLETLRVGMTVPAPRRTFGFVEVPWQIDAESFLAGAAARMANASEAADLSVGGGDFAYYTALSRVPFTSFTHVALPEKTDGQPEAAFGKFRRDGDRTLVPVGVMVNHLYVDGADLGDLYEAVSGSFERAF